MSDFLIYRSDQQPFPQGEAQQKLQSIGITNLRQTPEGEHGPALACEFHFSGDATSIRLSDDLETFSITERGEAALEFATRLQASYDEPLQIIDIGYTFDIPLKDYSNAAELEQAMQAAYEIDEDDNDDNSPAKK